MTRAVEDKKGAKFIARTSAWLMVVAVACLEPFPPPQGDGNLNLLVVDGFLNSTTGLAEVKLSRSVPLDAIGPFPAEQGSSVRVENENGNSYTLIEVEPGLYRLYKPLTIGERYRLIIQTTTGDAYESDYVVLKSSPILEDVFWVAEEDGVTIKLDARDPGGNTRYYQWFFTEVWEYDSDRASGYYVKGGKPVSRQDGDFIFVCYANSRSTKVLISTTTDQSGDVINDYPIVHIPRGSKKISRMYSINVQQRALDEDAYKFWLQLQKTNENLGGLFDPLPTQVTGNIHGTNTTTKIALGYFSGGGVEERRLFVRHEDLPIELSAVDRQTCKVDSVMTADLSTYPDYFPLLGTFGPFTTPDGYTVTKLSCLDCRLQGGVLEKPSYWPN